MAFTWVSEGKRKQDGPLETFRMTVEWRVKVMGRGSDGRKGQRNMKEESIWPHFPIWDSWTMMNFFVNFTLASSRNERALCFLFNHMTHLFRHSSSWNAIPWMTVLWVVVAGKCSLAVKTATAAPPASRAFY